MFKQWTYISTYKIFKKHGHKLCPFTQGKLNQERIKKKTKRKIGCRRKKKKIEIKINMHFYSNNEDMIQVHYLLASDCEPNDKDAW